MKRLFFLSFVVLISSVSFVIAQHNRCDPWEHHVRAGVYIYDKCFGDTLSVHYQDEMEFRFEATTNNQLQFYLSIDRVVFRELIPLSGIYSEISVAEIFGKDIFKETDFSEEKTDSSRIISLSVPIEETEYLYQSEDPDSLIFFRPSLIAAGRMENGGFWNFKFDFAMIKVINRISTSVLDMAPLDISVHPNPVEKGDVVTASLETPCKVTIYDLMGRVVFHSFGGYNSEMAIPTQNIPRGSYQIRFHSGTGTSIEYAQLIVH